MLHIAIIYCLEELHLRVTVLLIKTSIWPLESLAIKEPTSNRAGQMAEYRHAKRLIHRYVSLYTYMYTHINTTTTNMCVYVHTRKYISTYIYICRYKYMYIYIHAMHTIHIHNDMAQDIEGKVVNHRQSQLKEHEVAHMQGSGSLSLGIEYIEEGLFVRP